MDKLYSFAAIDFETANYYQSSVCSVGIVIVENGEITNKIYRLIRPAPNYYNYWNTQIHGLNFNDTQHEPDFPEVWATIAPHLRGLPMVAHNSPFDEGCLKAVFQYYKQDYPGYKFHCSCRMARKAYPQLINHRLNTVSAHCGFDLRNHHHALADAEACARIVMKIKNTDHQSTQLNLF